jgi:two-component system, cell cycle response regulator DivK
MTTVIIADDQELVRVGLRKILETAPGVIVAGEAADGQIAVTLAARLRPDLVLMDIRMPDLSGLDALRLLREDTRTADTPVVALTSSTMLGDEERFIAEGFDGYMQKPISVKEFPDQVRAHLRA